MASSDTQFKPGAEWRGQRGRKPGSKNAYSKSKLLAEAEKDILTIKRIARAILNGDMEYLATKGITKISGSMRMDAMRQLRSIQEAVVQAQKARLLEDAAAKEAKQVKKATFQRTASVTPIAKAG